MKMKIFLVMACLIFPAFANAGLAQVILPALVNSAPVEEARDNTMSSDSTPVAEVLEMWDKAHVVVDGYLVALDKSDGYSFNDDTGSIKVSLDHDAVERLNIASGDKVRIFGQVKKSFNSATLLGSRIERIQ